MSYRGRSVPVLLLAVACLAPVVGLPADRYVAVGGVDTGDCSDPLEPCATIGFAAFAAAHGDTVRVARGRYEESGISLSLAMIQGGWDADFFSRLEDPALTVVDGLGGARVLSLYGGTIQGLTLTNADRCVGGYSVSMSIKQSIISGCGTEGIYFYSMTGAPVLTVVNTIVVGNGTGIKVSQDSQMEFYGRTSLDLVSSTVSGNGTGVGLFADALFDEAETWAEITSSAVWGNGDWDVYLSATNYPTFSSHALVSVGEFYSDIGSVGFSSGCDAENAVCNYVGSILNLDPLFVAPPGDYHLRPSSPCVDTGSPTDSPPVDFEGDARPFDGDGDGTALPDIGADEMTGEVFSDGFETGDTSMWSWSAPVARPATVHLRPGRPSPPRRSTSAVAAS